MVVQHQKFDFHCEKKQKVNEVCLSFLDQKLWVLCISFVFCFNKKGYVNADFYCILAPPLFFFFFFATLRDKSTKWSYVLDNWKKNAQEKERKTCDQIQFLKAMCAGSSNILFFLLYLISYFTVHFCSSVLTHTF